MLCTGGVGPTYTTKTKRVLVKEVGQQIQVIPAKYDSVEETIKVSAASTRLIETPAVYGTDTESVLVRPATSGMAHR
uniref:Uncharacterized protein n=1 Tax=Candidatus Kentrum sp. MB TaxID=2138164 RepID=A0A450Y0T2_9GAMM|nr:MAG: hypothetical protein BECKMB1821G_GA0114241_11053 [Candidatus Kentron sp. MB]VFK35148.1 MAG: hypothetical protein BECKMB1821I_GA0114274_11023 [Candidatus Kentron sp. MB]VFK77168.1 MAG: hypothetical protein BECKMB1821H_GA0114242_11059 [Candidatus Kentron sp. MB]